MSTRRECLKDIEKTSTTNAGLWLDKFIRDQQEKDSRHKLVKEVASIGVPKEYSYWFARWRKTLQDLGAVCREAKVLGRMVVGLGEESVLETSVTLHHTYGVPYIPGSALKGLAAHFARHYLGEKWGVDTQAYKTVFGDLESAGYVTFFDALPLPPEGPNGKLLYPDVITVHHENYYQKGTDPPADWDNPNPVPFLSATGRYLVALSGPPKWVEATFEILQHALFHLGIGAKTSSGYGRLHLELSLSVDADQEKADELIKKIQGLKTAEVAGRIYAFYEQWRKLEINFEQKCRVANAIVTKIKESGREKQLQGKDWYEELLNSLSG